MPNSQRYMRLYFYILYTFVRHFFSLSLSFSFFADSHFYRIYRFVSKISLVTGSSVLLFFAGVSVCAFVSELYIVIILKIPEMSWMRLCACVHTCVYRLWITSIYHFDPKCDSFPCIFLFVFFHSFFLCSRLYTTDLMFGNIDKFNPNLCMFKHSVIVVLNSICIFSFAQCLHHSSHSFFAHV